MELFKDREDAGKKLAEKLQSYSNRADTIVLALPRGGVPVGFEVAQRLHIPLDVFIVRKLGVPGQPELAMGAIASGGFSYLNTELIERLSVTQDELQAVTDEQRRELQRREKQYRAGRPPLLVKDRRVILVDDGLATGASMMAAVQAVRSGKPRELIVAVPVVAASSIPTLESMVDKLVYVLAPLHFYAVGQWYRHFDQTDDEQVQTLLAQSNAGGLKTRVASGR